ncbi:MAG: flagellar export chaperone FliS [Planctomycetes bacterium]|nr:flagellar export chaperone FliS [Planctomycetota bacterium]NOG54974.1 flagellar export chaperone FliS [Planctomycetota bacterium]
MTTNDQAVTYLKTRVMSASPEELRLMLLDGSLKFARMAQEGLQGGDYEKVYDGVTRCQAILIELINCLDHSQDPDLCDRLSSLYTFLFRRLMDASTERNPEIVCEVIKLLEYERETWVLLMEQLVKDRRGSAAAEPDNGAATPEFTNTDQADGGQPRMLSVEG